MRRLHVVFLVVVLAAVLWGAGVAPMAERDPAVTAVSVRLTDAEAECVVGGQMACLAEGQKAATECARDNLDPFSPTAHLVGFYCEGVGIWATVSCAFSWFWGLFS